MSDQVKMVRSNVGIGTYLASFFQVKFKIFVIPLANHN